jgi:hypothetical protein
MQATHVIFHEIIEEVIQFVSAVLNLYGDKCLLETLGYAKWKESSYIL